jgi:hypothetical protein
MIVMKTIFLPIYLNIGLIFHVLNTRSGLTQLKCCNKFSCGARRPPLGRAGRHWCQVVKAQ